LGAAGAATRCPACARVLLEREQGRLTANRLDGGRCPGCGEPIPGSW